MLIDKYACLATNHHLIQGISEKTQLGNAKIFSFFGDMTNYFYQVHIIKDISK